MIQGQREGKVKLHSEPGSSRGGGGDGILDFSQFLDARGTGSGLMESQCYLGHLHTR